MSGRQRSATTQAKTRNDRRWARWLGGIIGGTLLAMAAMFAWRWHGLPDRVAAGLPAVPELRAAPSELRERLMDAQAQSRVRASVFDGVAELGRLYHANDYHDEAMACWRLLHAEQPREARWCYYLADLRRSASDYAGMESLLEQTVELAPDYAPAWLQLAELHFKSGDVDAAARAYRRRQALLPNDPHAGIGLARVALQNNQREKARRLLEQIVRDVPEFPASHNLLAEMLAADGDEAKARHHRWLGREAGRFRDAEDPWLSELQEYCYDPQRLQVLATKAFQSGQHDRALSLMQRAAQLAPDDPKGHAALGDLRLKLGDATGARDVLEQSLRLAEGTTVEPIIYVNLSHAYRALKEPGEALRVANEGLAQDDVFELYDAKGVALGDLGRHEEAVAAFHEAIRRNPNDANTNYNLGLSLLALGRHEEADAALKRSLTLRPTFPQTLSLLGHLELAAGRTAAAERYVRPLYESNPGVPEARTLMVQWLRRAGADAEANEAPEAAEKLYREGLVIAPDDAELNASLGVLLLVRGDVHDALDPLETFHRLRPDNPRASLFLGQAYARLGRLKEAREILIHGAQLAEQAGNTITAGYCREILQQL